MQHVSIHQKGLVLALSAALLIPLPAIAHAASAGASGDGSVAQPQQTDQSSNAPPAKAKASKPHTLKKITVLGSMVPRTEVEGAKPVMVVTGAQMKAEGYTTLWEFMDSLPQAGVSEPAFEWGATSVNARQLNLRNMGSQFSLLMIDGYRVVDYPQSSNGRSNFQNYNNIPSGMIDRVEVLGAGASSIYGADAVAGIVNVILKKRYQGDDIQLTAGGATRGGRQYGDLNWIGGRSGNHWHVVYNLEHTNRSPLWGLDRPVDSQLDSGYGTWDVNDRLFGFESAAEVYLKDINGNYISPPANSCDTIPTFRLHHDLTVNTKGDKILPGVTDHGAYCTQDVYRNWELTPGLISNDGYISGEYDLTDNLQAYGSVSLWRTTGISNTSLPFAFAFAGLPSHFYDAGTDQVITAFFRRLTKPGIGYSGNTYDNEQNWNLRAGLRGSIFDGNFNWDFNLGSQKYIVHEKYTGLNEQGMFNFFFGPQLGTKTINGKTYPVYDVNEKHFWYPMTPAEYSTFGVAGENTAWSWMDSATLHVNGDLFNVPWDGKPVGWAAVAEAYLNGYKLAPDPRGSTATFTNPFLALNTGGGTRHRYAFATEFRIPLFSTFDVDISGRLDKYNDASIADIARTWGIGLEWRPINSLLLRGSYGTNFKAPDMQAIYQSGSVVPEGIYADPLQCIKVKDVHCLAYSHPTFFNLFSGGNRNLLPETGHGWTYGLVWDVPWVNGLTMSADYWHTGVDNAIEYISLNTVLADEAGCLTGLQVSGAPYVAHPIGSPYCQLVTQDVTRDADGNISVVHIGPINEASLYVSGIDASLDYHLRTNNWGNFNLAINYTDNLSFKERTLANSPLINTRYEHVASKVSGVVNWNRDKWNASISGRRYGSLRDDNFGGCERLQNGIMPTEGDPSCTLYYGMVKPWITWSGSVGYQFDKRLKMTLVVHNIFDRIGDVSYYSNSYPFIPWEQGANLIGREVFLRINYKID